MESVKCYSVVHSAVQSYARHDLSTATATSTVAITSWLSLPGYHYLAITTTDGWANKRMMESKLFFHLMNRVGSHCEADISLPRSPPHVRHSRLLPLLHPPLRPFHFIPPLPPSLPPACPYSISPYALERTFCKWERTPLHDSISSQLICTVQVVASALSCADTRSVVEDACPAPSVPLYRRRPSALADPLIIWTFTDSRKIESSLSFCGSIGASEQCDRTRVLAYDVVGIRLQRGGCEGYRGGTESRQHRTNNNGTNIHTYSSLPPSLPPSLSFLT